MERDPWEMGQFQLRSSAVPFHGIDAQRPEVGQATTRIFAGGAGFPEGGIQGPNNTPSLQTVGAGAGAGASGKPDPGELPWSEAIEEMGDSTAGGFVRGEPQGPPMDVSRMNQGEDYRPTMPPNFSSRVVRQARRRRLKDLGLGLGIGGAALLGTAGLATIFGVASQQASQNKKKPNVGIVH